MNKSSRSHHNLKGTTILNKLSPVISVERNFPVVGIGASAGGLEALEQFLEHVPLNCGLAFVMSSI